MKGWFFLLLRFNFLHHHIINQSYLDLNSLPQWYIHLVRICSLPNISLKNALVTLISHCVEIFRWIYQFLKNFFLNNGPTFLLTSFLQWIIVSTYEPSTYRLGNKQWGVLLHFEIQILAWSQYEEIIFIYVFSTALIYWFS